MPYEQRLDRELEPELFLTASIFGQIPGFDYPLRFHNRRAVVRSVSEFYDSLDPETLAYLKSSEIRDRVRKTVSTLSEREQKVLYMLFGFRDGTVYTLKETGQYTPREKLRRYVEFDTYPSESVTRERIRQIEVRALRRLRHPSRSHELRSYLISITAQTKPENF